MKKSVYAYKSIGKNSSIDLELLLDVNRELTEEDNEIICLHMGKLIESLYQESIRLNPESKKCAEEEKLGIISVFDGRDIFVEEIPNGYCSSYCCKHLPWFIVTTNKGRIKIGWRKRVINIDWSDSIIEEDADTLFPNEDVTKFDKTIHAWGYEH